uniref:Uncharacterized protein n=1 Tax=Cyprinus carpio TaxID=7962 RepID=A0A8C1T1N5_CYPCA
PVCSGSRVSSPDRGTISSYHLALAKLYLLRGEQDSAEATLKDAMNPDIWALWGHLHYVRGDYTQAQSCYEQTLDSVLDASDMLSIYLRLGSIYLQNGELEELTEAEEPLTEANALNNSNPEVWGYLSLVCLRVNWQKLEAEQSYKYAIKVCTV